MTNCSSHALWRPCPEQTPEATRLETDLSNAKSLFRYGFDGTRQALFNAADKCGQFESPFEIFTLSKSSFRFSSASLINGAGSGWLRRLTGLQEPCEGAEPHRECRPADRAWRE